MRRRRDPREDPDLAAAEARREPAPHALLALQRSAGNQATTALVSRLTKADRPMLQARWLVHEDPNYYFWEPESGKGVPGAHEIPPYLKRIQRRDPVDPPYKVDDGDGEPTLVGAQTGPAPVRTDPHGRPYATSRRAEPPTFFEGDWYAERARQGGATRVPGDMFNPFGRFASAPLTAFRPAGSMPPEQQKALLERLALKDKSFRTIVATVGTDTFQGHARHVEVDGKITLPLAAVTGAGAVYAFGAPQPDAHAIAQSTQPAGNPAALGLVPTAAQLKYELNFDITPQLIANWQGQDRSETQLKVMGASAADAARNAGYVVNDGTEWEWLHMIAHSMGGIGGTTPQDARNLVAGTRECNSEMIIAEEMLKTIVVKTGGKGSAKLEVGVEMFDPVRHIASKINYTFVLLNSEGKASIVEHFGFNPLDKTQPQQFKNRAVRYAAMLANPEGKGATAWPTKDAHVVMSQPTTYDMQTPEAKLAHAQEEQLIELAQAGRLDDVFKALGEIWGKNTTVSGLVLDAIGDALVTADLVFSFLTSLRAIAGPRLARVEHRILYAAKLAHKVPLDQLQAVVTKLYNGTVPPGLVALLQ